VTIVICNQVGGVGIGEAARVLAAGGGALDAVELGIRPVESDPGIHSVGRGGWPNLLGQVELDACIMEGATLRTGAVGALQGYVHPISVARQVMERLPHVLLVGQGAARFAAECGAPEADNLTPAAAAAWEAWRAQRVSPPDLAGWPDLPLAPLTRDAADPQRTHGTTVFIAREASGRMAAGVSTSGWAFKYPGRLGDSPIVGAGSYVDDRYGGAACVGQGELTIRAGTARAVLLYIKMGLGLRAACHEAIADLARLRADLRSFVMIHAVSARGEHYAVAWGEHPQPRYWVWQEGMASPELCDAELVSA
jgi:L-asparaginase / beta-aspartyl-peptidase